MRKFYTAEAVTEGHPDKLCDQIADAILDVCLKNDENSRVACEVLATKGNIIVAGEITSAYEPDVFAVVRKVLSDIGYSSEGIAMDTFVHQQSPDIAGAVDTSKERREGVSDNQMDWFQGAGDQGVMIGYACDETKQLMPIPVVLANRIVRELSACRQSSYIQGILPDGKAQVLWSSIFVTLMANKIGGLQFGIYRNCQISSRVFHTAVAALPLTKANRSDFE